MRKLSLSNMVKGWVIGDFEPSLLKSHQLEVGVKFYNEGDTEDKHYHSLATEITIVSNGSIQMNNNKYFKGDIIIVEQNEPTDFKSLEDNTVTTVIKFPSVVNDKYFIG